MPVDILQQTLSLVATLYQLLQTAKSNQKKCQQLAVRIQTIKDQLTHLDRTCLNDQAFTRALRELQQVLQGALVFIQKFLNRNRLERVLNLRTDERRFLKLHGKIDQAVSQLQLGLQVQARQDQHVHEQAAVADRKQLLQQQHEIEAYCRGIWSAQHAEAKQARAQRDVLGDQLASLRALLQGIQPSVSSSPHQEQKARPKNTTLQTIPFCSLTFERRIATGSCGDVYLGRWCEQAVVIKRLEGEITVSEKKRFQREIKILTHLSHPHLVTLYGVCQEEGRWCLVIDALLGGSLRDRLNQQHFLPLERLQIAHTVARTLYYLSRQRVIHRRLRSTNLLFDSQGKVYVTDLGWSKPQSLQLSTLQRGKAGFAWEAPECLEGTPASSASDVYSFGVILWELLTGDTPFANQRESAIAQAVLAGDRPPLPSGATNDWVSLIKQCWAPNAWERPDWSTIIHRLNALVQSHEQQQEAKEKQQASQQSQARYFQQGRLAEKAKDYASAAQHYQKAADAGHVRASAYLGSLLLRGKPDLPADKVRAHQWLVQAANGGSERAAYTLAQQLFYGDGIAENKAAAANWLTPLASKRGEYQAKAQALLDQCQSLITVRQVGL